MADQPFSSIPTGLSLTKFLDDEGKYVGRSWLQWLRTAFYVIGTPVIGNGTPGQTVKTTLKGTGKGPTDPTTIVGFAQVNVNGEVRWSPLMK
jgi:hypothetical protein